jgi:hypothetical protein
MSAIDSATKQTPPLMRLDAMPCSSSSMIVMPSNNTGFDAGFLFAKHPGRLGHLHSVDAIREPRQGIPWALDNGVYGACKSGKKWSEEPLYEYLDQYAAWKPLWVVVPDWVGDRDETLRRWDQHAPALQSFGVPLAMAVQDGMTPSDVPKECAVVFVGGSTSWKWRSLPMWTASFPRVHVGRVNTINLLLQAENAGAESCDGTGWFQEPKRTAELASYLSHNHNHPDLLR